MLNMVIYSEIQKKLLEKIQHRKKSSIAEWREKTRWERCSI